MIRFATASTCVAFVAGCGGAVPKAGGLPTPAPASQERTVLPPSVATRLVVAVVVDQLPSSALERYLPLLDANGAFRQAVEHGVYCASARYDYAGTYTAPGHATLYTGALPRAHGVGANEVWDAARGKVVSVVDDAAHAVLGAPEQFASPSVLRVPTVADELERVTNGQALTVSLSFKDRAAVLPGGQHPDLVLFYDSKRGAFTTSSWYAGELPPALSTFQREHPLSERLSVWEPVDASALRRLLGPDAATGESDWQGLGRAFPHDPRRAPQPLTAVRVTPVATDYLFELARASVLALGLGTDDVPDLLMLSISSVDYAGHAFGPESWEYADSLVRTDRALTRFLAALPQGAGTRVLVTSDHGVAPLPERARERGHEAFRVLTKQVALAVNTALAGRFGLTGPVVASYTEPFVYLTREARGSPSQSTLLDAVATELEKTAGIARAYSVARLLAGGPTTELETLVRASITDDSAADLFVVPSEHSVVDPSSPGGEGTSHGSPWSYDRLVPVSFFGNGVEPTRVAGERSVLSVAPTLAALLGIKAPALASAAPLPGVPRAR